MWIFDKCTFPHGAGCKTERGRSIGCSLIVPPYDRVDYSVRVQVGADVEVFLTVKEAKLLLEKMQVAVAVAESVERCGAHVTFL